MLPTPTDHPLPRDGTSQNQRELAALQPARAPLDDRGLSELLVFAHRYSNLLLYYNYERKIDGTWQPFFDQFPVIQLALIAESDATGAQAAHESLQDQYQHAVAIGDPAAQASALRAMLDLAVAEIRGIDHWATSFASHAYHEEIEKVAANTIVPELEAAIRIAKALFPDDAANELAPLAKLQDALWQLDIDAIQPTPDLEANPPSVNARLLKDALDDLLEVLFKSRAYLAGKASLTLASPEIETGEQSPHLGLTLAFLKLFGIAQTYLNDISRQHLEHYYAKILGIQAKPAAPDSAFVIFELAKRIESETLAKATLLDAGKDASKKPIQFATDREITVNAAQLASIKSVLLDVANQSRVHAAAIANSADGAGAELDDSAPSWPLFGNAALAAGRVGFAVSTPALKASGGVKSLFLDIALTTASSDALNTAIQALDNAEGVVLSGHNSAIGSFNDLSALFAFRLTGAEAWIEPASLSVRHFVTARKLILIASELDATTPIANYDTELHGALYATKNPVWEILLRGDRSVFGYPLLLNIEYSKIELNHHVVGDRFLLAANDLGAVDVAKPFLPFGPAPTSARTGERAAAGSSFFIGSHEIFSKRLSALTFDVQWKDRPANLDTRYQDYVDFAAASAPKVFTEKVLEKVTRPDPRIADFVSNAPLGEPSDEETLAFQATVSYLAKGAWVPLGEKTATLLSPEIDFSKEELDLLPADASLPPFEKLSLDSPGGFLRLTLSSPSWGFGHALYPKILTTKILEAISEKTDPPTPPEEPYTPTIASLSANYTAVSVLEPGAAGAGDLELLLIEPHGAFAAPPARLVPEFQFAAATYLGLANLAPKQTISLLFELADGSGNPFVDYPEVTWSYLAGESWIEFATSEIISDSTNDLRRTGIVAFSIPPAATIEHTRMPRSLIWIRATVSSNPDAIHRAISIAPQAVSATFLDQGNDLARLAAPLPAGSIAKLARANSRIKSVSQPIASAGGSTSEGGSAYYRRVSERLRHKDRAIQIWDYEHLVLEAFPDVYKVKCIPHTSRAPSGVGSPDLTSELSPGDALVALVPNLLNRNAYNPLQPAVSQDTLADVQAFLQARASPFARIKTINPRYEEIEVIGEVYLHPEYDTGAYQTILEEDVIAYLTPWAFSLDAQIVFGKSMHSSQILNFIEELHYVDYLENFRVRHFVNGQALSPDPDELVPTAEHSILVSSPTHRLVAKKRATAAAPA